MATLEPPDDALLAAVLVKLFADRGVGVGPELIRYLLARMDRSFEAAERLVARLDRAALAARPAGERPARRRGSRGRCGRAGGRLNRAVDLARARA